MPRDLHELFDEATAEPRGGVDVHELWARGRRRRRVRLAGGSLGGLAVVALGVVAVANLVPGPVPAIEPTAPVDEPAVEAPDGDPAVDEPSVEAPDEEPAVDESAVDESAVDEAGGAVAPDAALVAEPCAEHGTDEAGAIPEAFIEVVSPVADQRIDATVELVGCASVYEGTVQYRLVDSDGSVLLEDFTTATAGGPGVGEFRVDIEPPARGGLVLEVYWEDVSDGSERDLVRVPVTVS